MELTPDWRRRVCPLCSGAVTHTVLAPTIHAIASENPGYAGQIAERLYEELGADTKVPIVRCATCGFVFAEFAPPAEVLDIVYGGPASEGAHFKKILDPTKRLRRVDDWHRLLVAGRSAMEISVVDYGCGWGDFLQSVASPGVRILGVEPYQRTNNVLAENVHVVSSTQEVAERFDFFMCDQVLEHSLCPVDSARDLHSVLRHGAIGLLGVPNFGRFDWSREQAELRRGSAVSTKDLNPIEHVNYFTGRHLRDLMERAGFKPAPRPALGRLDLIEQRLLDLLRFVRGRSSTRGFARALQESES